MGKIKIGIIDNERVYVERFSTYLNQSGKELWNVVGFTDHTSLEKYLTEKRIDLLIGTDRNLIERYRELFPMVCYIWLTENKTDGKGQDRIAEGIYSVYRYQSAKSVGQAVKDIVIYLGILKNTEKKTVAIYSPVGRCGKTTMAMNFVEGTQYGRWLYVGMEDYSYMVSEDKYVSEDFLYYVKERREEAVREMIGEVSGIIPSPFSPFDTRQIDYEDVGWFLNIFGECGAFGGVIFDMGTGVLQNLNVLLQFDYVVVPYINDKKSIDKKRQFEDLIRAYELEELFDRISYLDMDAGDPIMELAGLLK